MIINKKNLLFFFFFLFFVEFIHSQNIKCSFSPKFVLHRKISPLDSVESTYSTEIDLCNFISENIDTKNRTFLFSLKRQSCGDITHYQPFGVLIKENGKSYKDEQSYETQMDITRCKRLLCDKKIFIQFFLNGKDITNKINLDPEFLFYNLEISFD